MAEEALLHTKVRSRDRGLVALKSPTNINNNTLCEVKYGALYGGLPNDQLNCRFKWATVVAATNYETGDTKRRTDEQIMIWTSFATERSLISNGYSPWRRMLTYVWNGIPRRCDEKE